PGAKVASTPRNALFRNDGNWRFTDVTKQAGVGDTGFGLGVCAADYDNDGFVDLYVSNYGPNVLYRNNGDGTFRDATERAGVGLGKHVGAGVAFVDVDNDGHLDLFVANYIEDTLDRHQPHFHKGVPSYPGPLHHRPGSMVLFRNNGDGTFSDISREAGLADLKGHGMGVVAADYDGDGDQDLFVANDVQANFLLRNDGTGKFTDVAVLAGTAFDLAGNVQASMGVDAADFDNDGLVDFHVTSYAGEFATLYRNLGGGLFEDATRATRAGEGTLPHVTWGNGFADFDNDGQRDLFIACGHLDDNFHLRGGGGSTAFAVANVVLQNLGNSRFRNVSAQSGDGLKPVYSSRGAALGDLDGDGDPDIVVLNSREPPTLIRNDTSSGNHWLGVRLEGVESNRGGIGAHVKVHAGGAAWVDEVRSGRGYQSDFGPWLHFGLGKAARVEKIEVRWPSGKVSTAADVAPNQTILLREGEPGFRVLPGSGEAAREGEAPAEPAASASR
ncbi:MAG: CRTAC1 family protein, partial [Pirellulaceae bacterium]